MFPNKLSVIGGRRPVSARDEAAVSEGAVAYAAAAVHDENYVPAGSVDLGGDQSDGMAGKLTALSTTTRSVLAALPTNTLNGPNGVRNLRARTQQQNVPVKEKESSGADENSLPKEEPVVIFPVKQLRAAGLESSVLDKENIDPSVSAAVAANFSSREWDDLDAEDAGDPLMVSEYVTQIFEYMRQIEKTALPRADYIKHQKELTWHMRSILVDWLIEVHWKLKLLPETLYLSINIVDRFLSSRAVSLTKLQLVGLAATLLASKYEEVVSPSIANFIFLADNAYKTEELLNAERYILQVLGFSLAYPSPLSFLRRISKAESYDLRSRTLAKYLMEVALLDQSFITVPSSALAAAGIFTARLMLKSGPWTSNLVHFSGYGEADLRRISNRLLFYLQQEQQYCTIHRKYASKKYMKAAIYVHDWIKRHFPNCAAAKTVYYASPSADISNASASPN